MTGTSAADELEKVGLRVSNLSFRYAERTIFEHLDFGIPAGEIWGLVGRSGIGKTTLLNVLLGLYRPSAGEVTIDDTSIDAPGAIRGVVFRESSLLPWLNVIDNVLFSIAVGPDDEATDRAVALLSEAGLSASLDRLPKELSAGMAKRVEIIRALVMDEHYFVADEPFAGLDVLTRLDLHRIWVRLNQTHARTGILCTHDPAEAAALCDAVLVMRDAGNGVASVVIVRTDRFGRGSAEGLLGVADPIIRSLVDMMGHP